MSQETRRDFLKKSGAALAAGALLPAGCVTTPRRQTFQAEIPLHRSIEIEGVHVYADELSVAAGETIRFYLSGTLPYEFQVCRLGQDVDSPLQDEVLQSWRVEDPVMQPIHPGSYVAVEKPLADRELPALTLECWIRLWKGVGRQGVITQLDGSWPGGYGLFVEEDGAVSFSAGGGVRSTEAGLLSRPAEDEEYFTNPPAKWHHVVATTDGTRQEIFVDGRRVGRWNAPGAVKPGTAPLRIGAFGHGGRADGFLDADLAMPAIYARALSEDEIKERFSAKALQPPVSDGLLACWPLDEELGDRIADVSGHQRYGRIVNHGTWMIGGPTFDPKVGQFADYDPAEDATRGHGLGLASDDLYDCRWTPTFEYRIPEDAKSGVYVGRIRFGRDGEERLSHAAFIVKKAAAAAKAPIAFLFSTNTWKAYSATPFCPTWPGIKKTVDNWGHEVDPNDPKAAYCFYRHHRGGQPAFQMGMRMPWSVAGPYTTVYDVKLGFSHLCRADRFTEVWLEREGYDYDAISDLDLHRDPRLLDGYKTVFVVGHSEYWSFEAYEHLRRFLASGGSLVNLSGNTMFWRVSFNDDASIIECRKVDGWGAQIRPDERGQCWHSHDGKRGGPPRDCGFPAWKVLGVEFLSYNAMGGTAAGPFRVADPDHFLFQKPHRIDVKKGDRFGFDPEDPRRQAVGDESDVRVSTLMKHLAGPVPDGAPTGLTDPPGMELLAEAVYDWSKTPGRFFDYYHRELPPEEARKSEVAGEMIYWQRPDGGRVFSASSIASGWVLGVDKKWSDLLKNALHSFGCTAAPQRRSRAKPQSRKEEEEEAGKGRVRGG